MKRITLICAVFLLALEPFPLSVHGAGTALETQEYSLARLRELANQFSLELQISAEELDAGVARGEWTADEAASGKRLAQSTLAPAMEAHALAYPLLARPTDGGRAIPFLNARFSPRFLALVRYQHQVSSELLKATDRAVADIWAAANKPEDLQSAVRLMRETLAEFKPTMLSETHFYISIPASSTPPPTSAGVASLPGSATRFAAVDKFKDFYSMIFPDAPFVFPDPAVDPAGFRAMWRYYVALQHDIYNGFFEDRTVRARIEALELQYRADEKQAWAALDKAFSENAPAEITAAALDYAAKFAPLPPYEPFPNTPARPVFPPRTAATPPPRNSAADLDYRLIAAPWLNENPDKPESYFQRRQGWYREWIAFRRAEEAGNREEVAKLAKKFLQNLGAYPSDFAAHLSERLTRP